MIDSLRLLFMHWNGDSNNQIQPAGGRLAATARRSRTTILLLRSKMQASPFGVPIKDAVDDTSTASFVLMAYEET